MRNTGLILSSQYRTPQFENILTNLANFLGHCNSTLLTLALAVAVNCSIVGNHGLLPLLQVWEGKLLLLFPNDTASLSTCGLNCPTWENLAEMATKMSQMGKDMVMTSSEVWLTSATTCTTFRAWCGILSGISGLTS
jgi:hypothetical protein